MKKVFLTSSGIPREKAHVFFSYVGKPASEIKVAFIPTAADPDENKSYVEKTKNELHDIGLEFTEIDLKKLTPKTASKKLKPFDVYVVNGGNTFYLLHWMKKSGFAAAIDKLLDDTGRVYVGVSAGSIAAGPDISAAGWSPEWDKNDVKIKDMSALNLVDFVVIPHYQEKDKELIEGMKAKVKYNVVGLEDGKIIFLRDGK